MSKRKLRRMPNRPDSAEDETSPIESSKKTKTMATVQTTPVTVNISLPEKLSLAELGALVESTFLKMASNPFILPSRTQIYRYFFSFFVESGGLNHKRQIINGRKLLAERLRADLASQRAIRSEFIFEAFKALAESNDLLNGSIFYIITAILVELDPQAQAKVIELVINQLSVCFESQHNKDQACWTSNFVTQMRQPIKTINFQRFFEISPVDRLETGNIDKSLVDGLVLFASRVLDVHGAEINDILLKPRTLQESFSYLVRVLMTKIFKESSYARSKILKEFLAKSFDPNSNQAVYANQLEMLFNDEIALELFAEPSSIFEKGNLIETIMDKFTDGQLKRPANVQRRPHSPGQKSMETPLELMASGLLDTRSLVFSTRLVRTFRTLFFLADKSKRDQFAILVEFLEPFCRNQREEILRAAMLSLVELVKALNLEPTVLPSQVPKILKQSRERWLRDNHRQSLQIVRIIRDRLPEITSAQLKTQLYQSFSSIIKANPELTEAICDLLVQQMDACLVPNSPPNVELHFDLVKCFRRKDERLVLTEPVDVLFHCAALCAHQLEPARDSVRSVHRLQAIINSICIFYSKHGPAHIFDVYKRQMAENLERAPVAASYKLLHQIELGFFDVVLEVLLQRRELASFALLLDKYTATSSLISADIELMMTQALSSQPSSSSSRKRKIDEPKATGIKRFKSSASNALQNKENPNQVATTRSRAKRAALADSTNVSRSQPVALAPPPPSEPKNSPQTRQMVLDKLSFANIQFEHSYRISSNCLTVMLGLFVGGAGSDTVLKLAANLTEKRAESLGGFSISNSLITNERFNEFFIKVVEATLKNMSSSSHITYEPLASTDLATFKFLSDLWRSFLMRVTGSDLGGGSVVFKEDLSQRFSSNYFARTVKLVSFCRSIWAIVCDRFPAWRDFLDDFQGIETQSQAQNQTRNVIISLMKTIKNFTPLAVGAQLSDQLSECMENLLDLVHMILKSSDISGAFYSEMYAWFHTLAERPIAADERVGKSLFRLLFHIANHFDHPLLLVRNLSKDISTFVRNETDSTTPNYRLVSKREHLLDYQRLSKETVEATFDQIRSLIDTEEEPSRRLVDASESFVNVCMIIEEAVLIVRYLLTSVDNVHSAQVVLELLADFFDFMVLFFNCSLIGGGELKRESLVKLHHLVEFIDFNLQQNLVVDLNRIKALIVHKEQKHDNQKASQEELMDIIQSKLIINKLIESVDAFEKTLQALANVYIKRINLLKGSSSWPLANALKACPDFKITRTISESDFATFASNL